MSHLPVPAMPCLVVDPEAITGDEGRTVLMDSRGECHTRDIEALGSNMRFSLTWQAGWILACDPVNNGRTFLYNPFINGTTPLDKNKVELPHFPEADQLSRNFECALSDANPSSWSDDGCIVVVLHPEEPTLWYCRVGAGDDGEGWIRYDYDIGTQPGINEEGELITEKTLILSLTPCPKDKKFYFHMSPVENAVLELDSHPATRVVKMEGLPLVVPPNPWGYRAHPCCFEMDGDIYMLNAYYYEHPRNVTGVGLFRMDAAGRRWDEVRDIGDRAVLWYCYRGGCCSASRFGLEPNCVYWISSVDSSMKIFDIGQKTQKVCDPPKHVPKLSSEAFWILP